MTKSQMYMLMRETGGVTRDEQLAMQRKIVNGHKLLGRKVEALELLSSIDNESLVKVMKNGS